MRPLLRDPSSLAFISSPNDAVRTVRVTCLSPTLLYNQCHSDCKTQDENYTIDIGVHRFLLHLIHTLDCPERSSGGEKTCVSPNGHATGAVRETFLSHTLPHRDCHSGSKLSHDIPIIETGVWGICIQLLRILDGLKRKFWGGGARDVNLTKWRYNGATLRAVKGLIQ